MIKMPLKGRKGVENHSGKYEICADEVASGVLVKLYNSIYSMNQAILEGHMEDFVTEVSVLGARIVDAAVEVYQKICSELLPTPAKSHYVFNLRDLSKCMQGVLQADAAYMRAPQGMLRYLQLFRLLQFCPFAIFEINNNP